MGDLREKGENIISDRSLSEDEALSSMEMKRLPQNADTPTGRITRSKGLLLEYPRVQSKVLEYELKTARKRKMHVNPTNQE